MNIKEQPPVPKSDEPATVTPVTPATERPLVEPADQVVAPDPLGEARPMAACLPNDADDLSDAGSETTDRENEGWRANRLSKP